MSMIETLPVRPTTNAHRLVIAFPPSTVQSDDDLMALSHANKHLRIERTSEGEIIVMGPTGADSGDRNSEINLQLRLWAKRSGNGRVFDSSTGFSLPNGSLRSPDAAWLSNTAFEQFTAEQKRGFLRICPESVIELRSETDSVADLQYKL